MSSFDDVNIISVLLNKVKKLNANKLGGILHSNFVTKLSAQTLINDHNNQDEVFIAKPTLTIDTTNNGVGILGGTFQPEAGYDNLIHTHTILQLSNTNNFLSVLQEIIYDETQLREFHPVLNPSTIYYVRIRYLSNAFSSDWSSVDVITTPAGYKAINKPNIPTNAVNKTLSGELIIDFDTDPVTVGSITGVNMVISGATTGTLTYPDNKLTLTLSLGENTFIIHHEKDGVKSDSSSFIIERNENKRFPVYKSIVHDDFYNRGYGVPFLGKVLYLNWQKNRADDANFYLMDYESQTMEPIIGTYPKNYQDKKLLVLSDTEIMVIGGSIFSSGDTNPQMDTYIATYNESAMTMSYEVVGSPPYTATRLAPCILTDGTIISMSGYGIVFVYDKTTRSWTAMNTYDNSLGLNGADTHVIAHALPNNTAIAIYDTGDTQIYNGDDETITNWISFGVQLKHATTGMTLDNRIIICGGFENDLPNNKVYTYNYITKTFTLLDIRLPHTSDGQIIAKGNKYYLPFHSNNDFGHNTGFIFKL